MLDQLIALTNREDFWGNWHLCLEDAQFSAGTFTFTVSTKMGNHPPADDKLTWWKVKCEGVVEEKIIDRLFVPNTTINIFDNHPLLIKYEKSIILRISGKVRSLSELLGDLFQIHMNITGNWLDFPYIVGGL